MNILSEASTPADAMDTLWTSLFHGDAIQVQSLQAFRELESLAGVVINYRAISEAAINIALELATPRTCMAHGACVEALIDWEQCVVKVAAGEHGGDTANALHGGYHSGEVAIDADLLNTFYLDEGILAEVCRALHPLVVDALCLDEPCTEECFRLDEELMAKLNAPKWTDGSCITCQSRLAHTDQGRSFCPNPACGSNNGDTP